MIARCGTVRINHWAHKVKHRCDICWESETPWHRQWKDKFPRAWQELKLADRQTGQWHFADVCTSYGLVVEFQHSHISKQAKTDREQFYGNLVWVVDGARLKMDYRRFIKAKPSMVESTTKPGVFMVQPHHIFNNAWISRQVPVLFDFQDAVPMDEELDSKRLTTLFCLFPIRFGEYRVMAEVPHSAFIRHVIKGSWTDRYLGLFETMCMNTNQIFPWLI